MSAKERTRLAIPYLPPSMASVSVPLPSEHPDNNLTTRHSPPNFSKPFGSLGRSDTPHFTLHEFRKLQSSATSTPSFDSNHKRLRRKPSRRDLSTRRSARFTDGAPVTCKTSPLDPLPSHKLPSPFLPPPPSTPQYSTGAASFSLASTSSTLQSSPVRTPVPAESLYAEQWESAGGQSEAIRHKRKFPSIKHAKRLPHHAFRGWCVYAAVLDTGESDFAGDGRGEEIYVAQAGKESEPESAGGRTAGKETDGRRGRSVRFAGVRQETSSSGERSDSGGPRDTFTDSTYTLSKFKFPTPPNHIWASTFGTCASF